MLSTVVGSRFVTDTNFDMSLEVHLGGQIQTVVCFSSQEIIQWLITNMMLLLLVLEEQDLELPLDWQTKDLKRHASLNCSPQDRTLWQLR